MASAPAQHRGQRRGRAALGMGRHHGGDPHHGVATDQAGPSDRRASGGRVGAEAPDPAACRRDRLIDWAREPRTARQPPRFVARAL